MPLTEDRIEWLCGLQVGTVVGVYFSGNHMYNEVIKAKYDDCILLNNRAQFDEYGDEIILTLNDEFKQYLGDVK